MSGTDFLVIGGGIAGVSAAARLAPYGSTTLIEAESSLGYHASGRSAALYEPNYGSPSTIALNHASLPHHQSADGGVLTPRGLMLVGTGDNRAAFEADQKTMDLPTITLEQAKSLCPILNTEIVRHAAHSTAGQDIDTDKLLQGFARQLRHAGGTIFTNQQVTALRRTSPGWQITTTSQTLTAKTLINAAGAWADQIAGLAGLPPLGLRPLRRSMARVPAPDGYDVTHWPMLMGPEEAWYCKPDAGALLVSPADQDLTPPHDAFADDMTLAEGLARFEAHVYYDTKRLLASWAGLRTFAPDGSLVIGPAPQDPSFVWCAGQGGYGMQSAPAASQLLADLVTGKLSELDSKTRAALSPARFS